MEIAYTSLNSLTYLVWLVAKGAKFGRRMCEVGSPKVRTKVAKGAKLVGDSAKREMLNNWQLFAVYAGLGR